VSLQDKHSSAGFTYQKNSDERTYQTHGAKKQQYNVSNQYDNKANNRYEKSEKREGDIYLVL